MANYNHLGAVMLVFLLLTSASSSSARPLNEFSLATTEPTFNLALPSDRVASEEQGPARHVSPCHHMRVTGKMPSPGRRKYGPMILNMLPKGKVPPSGPSKGTNNLNN